MFDNTDIQTIMRMIARWYDVKVEYAGPVTDERFGGSVSRFSNVSVQDWLKLNQPSKSHSPQRRPRIS